MKTELIEQPDVPTGSSRTADHQHLLAIAWIAVAWIVGSLVFEVTADGGEATLAGPSIMQQWQQQETDYAIAFAGIDDFDRIQRESELRPVFQAVIANAEQKLAEKTAIATKSVAVPKSVVAQIDATNPVTKNQVTSIPATITLPGSHEQGTVGKITGEKITAEKITGGQFADANDVTEAPVVAEDAIPQLIQQVVHSFQEWMSPVHVDVPSRAISAPVQEVASMEEFVEPISTIPVVNENDQLESVTVTEAHIVRAEAKPVIVPQRNAVVINSPVMPIMVVADKPENEAVETPSAAKTEPVDRVAAKWPIDAGKLLSGNLLGNAKSQDNGVSLNVDKADVRGVIEILARGYGMNILVAPDVKGTVTANVEGLTPEQALDGVIKMCNLNLQRDGDLIYIYPDTKLPSDARELRVFTLDFARAETLEPAVQGLLSPVGSAFTTQLDASDNMQTQETIVVIDIPAAVMQVENYIFQADRAPRQVMIEAHILEVQLEDDMKHGVNFGSFLGGDLRLGAMNLADPIANASNPLFFAQIDGSRVTSLIDMLETTTDSKTLASPRLQVINGQNARIQVGAQLGYQVATVTQTSTIQDVQFLETGVVLTVTPTISRDNRILMVVKPEVSDGQVNVDTSIPDKVTREVETSVLLDDHQGVVIGGLIQEKDETIIRKLPWLGDVKYVGKLFQRREATRSRTEIVVALTCHIVEPCAINERTDIELQRTNEKLFHGLLQRNCRPWEPRMPDTAGSDRHLDVNKVNRRLP